MCKDYCRALPALNAVKLCPSAARPTVSMFRLRQHSFQFYHKVEEFHDIVTQATTMSEKFILQVDLDKLRNNDDEGQLDFKTISYLDRALINVNKTSLDFASQFIQQNFNACTFYVNATDVDVTDALNLLSVGAVKVFVSFSQFKQIIEKKVLEDVPRLVVCLDSNAHEASVNLALRGMIQELQETKTSINFQKAGVFVQNVQDSSILDQVKALDSKSRFSTVYATITPESTDNYVRIVKSGAVPVVSASSVTSNTNKYPWKIPAAAILLGSVHTDRPDGLWTTIVVNEHGVCLGLVYSNQESVDAALQSGRGVFKSRKREGLWYKGESSGDTQELIRIGVDCDEDCLIFTVRQKGDGFCHLKTDTCFGPYSGLSKLEKTLKSRASSAPEESYTARLFKDPKLLKAKILEEASELGEAETKADVAAEAADLIYFALTKCIAAEVGLSDVEKNLDFKSLKVSRRKGDAKPQWAGKVGLTDQSKIVQSSSTESSTEDKTELVKEAASVPKSKSDDAGIQNSQIKMQMFTTEHTPRETISNALQRPSQRSTDDIMKIVQPIISKVQAGGDEAVLAYTHKFEKATSLTSPVLRAPFSPDIMKLPQETIEAIDISFENIRKFHAAQMESRPLKVETMPGVICSRFARPIERVGLYVPGGTAVLPSTALMLGVPAMVAGCKNIVMASPPRADGTLTPEVVYAAHKVGAESIVLAGGAQAVAAMAYGTESITKVDKILGPGNQFVTAAKMLVSNDTTARVAIDMPAGPSEVLVIADSTANPAFVASDLLSQAEHGVDSQVVLIGVALSMDEVKAIEEEFHRQASALPRVDIVRGAINHSVTLLARDLSEAMELSNQYAPEHLILQIQDAEQTVDMVQNAGSVFIGMWTPESVGDYSAGVNHSLRESPPQLITD